MRWLSLGFLAAVVSGCQPSENLPVASLTPAEPPPDAPTPSTAEAEPEPTSRPDLAEGEAFRVGGDLFAKVEQRGESFVWQQLAVTTPLPRGYPPPTPPGAIELKHYPTVRRAQFSGRRNADRGMNSGFWPLFRHISARDIEMTSPVEMEYHGMSVSGGDAPAEAAARATAPPGDEWTMSFLYRTADLGPTGDDGVVRVADTPSVTVLAVGLRGDYTQARVRAGLDQLAEWLAAQREWEPAGSARAMFYNGPDTKRQNLWGEAQIPVRPKAARRAAAR